MGGRSDTDWILLTPSHHHFHQGGHYHHHHDHHQDRDDDDGEAPDGVGDTDCLQCPSVGDGTGWRGNREEEEEVLECCLFCASKNNKRCARTLFSYNARHCVCSRVSGDGSGWLIEYRWNIGSVAKPPRGG